MAISLHHPVSGAGKYFFSGAILPWFMLLRAPIDPLQRVSLNPELIDGHLDSMRVIFRDQAMDENCQLVLAGEP